MTGQWVACRMRMTSTRRSQDCVLAIRRATIETPVRQNLYKTKGYLLDTHVVIRADAVRIVREQSAVDRLRTSSEHRRNIVGTTGQLSGRQVKRKDKRLLVQSRQAFRSGNGIILQPSARKARSSEKPAANNNPPPDLCPPRKPLKQGTILTISSPTRVFY